jgi:mono/diheme cytochrome c family protein
MVLAAFASLTWASPDAIAEDSVAPPGATSPVFERDIRPILKTHCIGCHGEGKKLEARLDLRLRRTAVAGGKLGPAVLPGNGEESPLWTRMIDGEMPPEHIKVRPTEAQIETVKAWIDAGALTARPEPADVAAIPEILPEERLHWAYQPIRKPEVPRPSWGDDEAISPVDASLLAELKKVGLGFGAEATRESLIRRLSFDLTGLPPSPEEIDRFLADRSPDAWAKLVDRYAASPRYGEQWARHWLDVAGYADSEGGNELDTVRADAWRYRDYVIRALNQDRPFDRFVTEQLAGDELVGYPLPARPSPEQAELLAATGFLRMAPDPTGRGEDNTPALRNQVISDTVKIVSSTFYGLTIGCAECHNHRYDPILQKDFYRIRAAFEPGFDPARWRTPPQRSLSFVKPGDEARTKEVNDALTPARKKLDEAVEKARRHVFEDELKKLSSDDLRKAARVAWPKAAKERTAEEKKLMEDYPNLDVPKSIGALKLYLELDKAYKPFNEAIEVEEKAIAAIQARRPAPDTFRAFVESDAARKQPPETKLLDRGDVESPRESVPFGDLTVLYDSPGEADLEPASVQTSTGRRLALARRLTSGTHPLLARVIVNRVWQQHFGRGLSDTPGDFGSQGTKPTHPELLDWLAADFMEHGWSLKRLHRQILTSRAWRQSTARREEASKVDPENRLWHRMDLRRLSAESVRDALLTASGDLRTEAFGPPVRVAVTEDGQPQVQGTADQVHRRTIYLQVLRQAPLPSLEAFDAPKLDPNCEVRQASNVPTQALLMMNDAFVGRVAERFAAKLTDQGGDDRTRLERACRAAWGRPPTSAEADRLLAFLNVHRNEILGNQKVPDARKSRPEAIVTETPPDRFDAWTRLCQTILQANAFLYLD